MSTVAQRSFSGGEISSALYARVDVVKYSTGLRTCRNFLLARHGGAYNRPGTQFVAEVKDSSKTVRLIPFIFNASQTYALEFGDLYMRVIKNGVQVLEAAFNITNITQANPAAVTTSAPHGYSNGQEVFISGVLGMTELNSRNFKVANVGVSTFELRYMDGTTPVNSTGFGVYISGGTTKRVFTLTTPYVEADLQEIQFVQSADVITLVHPNYAPRELARFADTTWTITAITFDPSIARPTQVLVTAGAAGTKTFRYRVTAIKRDTFEESLPGTESAFNINAITQSNPATVGVTAVHNYLVGDEVFIQNVSGMTQVNNRTFTVGSPTAPMAFFLKDVNSTGYTAYTAGGQVLRTSGVVLTAADPTTLAPITITWIQVADAVEYNIYREVNGKYGFIGIAQSTSFSDTGFTPDTSDTPPVATNYFKLAGDFPSAVSYFQQRLLLANTDNDPELIVGSRTAQFKNLTTHQPLQDDDALAFSLTGRQVNEIRHMIDIGAFVTFTTGGEWTIEGDAAGILTPTDINPKQRGYNGSGTLSPLIVGGNALYIQGRGSVIRDLAFDFQVESYRGNDLTIFAAHLFENNTLRDWAYQQIPHSIVWAARSDGILLGLTYVREHQVWGWHHHDFGGNVEQTCVIPEGEEDSLYIVVKRTIPGLSGIGGSTRRYRKSVV